MEIDPSTASSEMVDRQLRARGIADPDVLRAMRRVPRHEFVPETLVERAYQDTALPIEEHQTISQPYIVALMAEALALPERARVLEIGTGSGYAAAVLAEVAEELFTIERHRSLAVSAAKRLARLGYRNVHVRCRDGTRGWPEAAPFDGIAVTAGAPRVPERLKEQLAAGARLVIPVGTPEEGQRLLAITRQSDGSFLEEFLCEVRFVPLVSEGGGDER